MQHPHLQTTHTHLKDMPSPLYKSKARHHSHQDTHRPPPTHHPLNLTLVVQRDQ